MRRHVLVAFDGLSLAGKSTMVQMLFELSTNAIVVRENTLDPIRFLTSKANKLLKTWSSVQVIDFLVTEFSQFEQIFKEALQFSSRYTGEASKQALLAYLFTRGRRYVNDYVCSEILKKDIILDRWQLTGWAYQSAPGFSWQDIRDLNAEFGIIMPDIQIILTCPIEQIPIRRAYREKIGLGTAGQMSKGREEIILTAFQEIYGHLKRSMPIYIFENKGEPVENLWFQIKQTVPVFEEIKRIVRTTPFYFSSAYIENPELFWREPNRLSRIRVRQIQ